MISFPSRGGFRTEKADSAGWGRLLAYTLLDVVVDNIFWCWKNWESGLKPWRKAARRSYAAHFAQDPAPEEGDAAAAEVVWPMREVISSLERGSSRHPGDHRIYLRDVYDHTIQVMDTIEIFRDMLSACSTSTSS